MTIISPSVEEPCQLGCNGLNFCTMMNNRPLEHFRTCNADADNAAHEDILSWQEGTINLPGISIPVKGFYFHVHLQDLTNLKFCLYVC